MSIPSHICSEVSFPSCKLFDVKSAKYCAASSNSLGFTVNSPYTVTLLFIAALCAIRMILHVNSLYASIGRAEMRTIFALYTLSNSIQMMLVGFPKILNKSSLFLFVNAVQMSLESTTFFSLFVSSVTIDRIYGILWMSSGTFMRILCAIYYSIIFSTVLVCCLVRNEYIMILIFAFNALSVLSHLFVHASRLRRTKGEIWGYGVLWIIMIFFSLSVAHMFYGANLIALLSNRNLESLFFVHLYQFMTVMMIHKFWLSTCDFELECLALNV